jgi:thioester reductase-like protein
LSVFITGATGFLGTQLLPLLAARYPRLLLLVRDKEAASSYFSGSSFKDQLDFLEGDLYKPFLGISNTVWKQYKDEITEIWHCGANLSFSVRQRQEVMNCNLNGTIMVLEKAK